MLKSLKNSNLKTKKCSFSKVHVEPIFLASNSFLGLEKNYVRLNIKVRKR